MANLLSQETQVNTWYHADNVWYRKNNMYTSRAVDIFKAAKSLDSNPSTTFVWPNEAH